ncbi:MAG: anthranilate synthase component I family protein, partial [Dehalococcoidia bacterium]|nr:anthranilate synthase component I family protein [Dehalococcoidia bacterium]
MLPIFEELSTSYNPFDLAASFLQAPHFVFLDSGMAHDRFGRYSYITADPFLLLRSKGSRVDILEDGRATRLDGDPFTYLQSLWQQLRLGTIPGLPPFQGGIAGYFGYDLCHHVERLPRRAFNDLDLFDMYVGCYDWVLAHDHVTGQSWIVATGGREQSRKLAEWRLGWVRERLAETSPRRHGGTEKESYFFMPPNNSQIVPATKPTVDEPTGNSVSPCLRDKRILDGLAPDFESNFSKEAYIRSIQTAKEYIAAGEIYQVNLSQRFETNLAVHPWQLYTRLREVNPAPFAAYLGFDDVTVISSSPEQFLKVGGQNVETRPIKGTRPRGRTPDEDISLAAELLSSMKDRAENVMIVDLLRNDIGRVCQIGSVHVPELVILEEYPTVFHLVSTVAGVLDPRYDAVDLLRACFPGGSVTGCPKIRSMEIIDELEPTQRGVYCGA